MARAWYRGTTGWLPWEAARGLHYVQQCQCQTAPRWIHRWPNESGNAMGLTYLMKGKKAYRCTCSQIEEWEPVREPRGSVPGTRAQIPLRPMSKTVVRQLSPYSPQRFTEKPIITCSPWRTPCQSRWVLKGGWDPLGSPHWSRLAVGPVVLWGEDPMQEQSIPKGLHPVAPGTE